MAVKDMITSGRVRVLCGAVNVATDLELCDACEGVAVRKRTISVRRRGIKMRGRYKCNSHIC